MNSHPIYLLMALLCLVSCSSKKDNPAPVSSDPSTENIAPPAGPAMQEEEEQKEQMEHEKPNELIEENDEKKVEAVQSDDVINAWVEMSEQKDEGFEAIISDFQEKESEAWAESVDSTTAKIDLPPLTVPENPCDPIFLTKLETYGGRVELFVHACELHQKHLDQIEQLSQGREKRIKKYFKSVEQKLQQEVRDLEVSFPSDAKVAEEFIQGVHQKASDRKKTHLAIEEHTEQIFQMLDKRLLESLGEMARIQINLMAGKGTDQERELYKTKMEVLKAVGLKSKLLSQSLFWGFQDITVSISGNMIFGKTSKNSEHILIKDPSKLQDPKYVKKVLEVMEQKSNPKLVISSVHFDLALLLQQIYDRQEKFHKLVDSTQKRPFFRFVTINIPQLNTKDYEQMVGSFSQLKGSDLVKLRTYLSGNEVDPRYLSGLFEYFKAGSPLMGVGINRKGDLQKIEYKPTEGDLSFLDQVSLIGTASASKIKTAEQKIAAMIAAMELVPQPFGWSSVEQRNKGMVLAAKLARQKDKAGRLQYKEQEFIKENGPAGGIAVSPTQALLRHLSQEQFELVDISKIDSKKESAPQMKSFSLKSAALEYFYQLKILNIDVKSDLKKLEGLYLKIVAELEQHYSPSEQITTLVSDVVLGTNDTKGRMLLMVGKNIELFLNEAYKKIQRLELLQNDQPGQVNIISRANVFKRFEELFQLMRFFQAFRSDNASGVVQLAQKAFDSIMEGHELAMTEMAFIPKRVLLAQPAAAISLVGGVLSVVPVIGDSINSHMDQAAKSYITEVAGLEAEFADQAMQKTGLVGEVAGTAVVLMLSSGTVGSSSLATKAINWAEQGKKYYRVLDHVMKITGWVHENFDAIEIVGASFIKASTSSDFSSFLKVLQEEIQSAGKEALFTKLMGDPMQDLQEEYQFHLKMKQARVNRDHHGLLSLQDQLEQSRVRRAQNQKNTWLGSADFSDKGRHQAVNSVGKLILQNFIYELGELYLEKLMTNDFNFELAQSSMEDNINDHLKDIAMGVLTSSLEDVTTLLWVGKEDVESARAQLKAYLVQSAFMIMKELK